MGERSTIGERKCHVFSQYRDRITDDYVITLHSIQAPYETYTKKGKDPSVANVTRRKIDK